jgi:hypothetical protein
VYHDVDAGGNCRVPWCSFSSDVEGSEHLNIDRVMNEPGQYNPFKKLQRLEQEEFRMQGILATEFRDEMHEDADWEKRRTHDLTLMVLRLLKNRADGRNDKVRAIGRERDQLAGERSSLLAYIWETFEQRAQLLESSGVENGIPLVIGIMENLRDQLDSMTKDKVVGDGAEPSSTEYPKGDPMRPEARRNVTLNDLRTTLLGMLLSGVDVTLKDLDAYLERYVQAVDSIVRRSTDLERAERDAEYSHASLVRFMVWLRDEYTGDFNVSAKAAEVLAKAP